MARLAFQSINGIIIVIFCIIAIAISKDVDLNSQFSLSNAKFATKFYKTVVDSAPGENIVISPFSVQIAGALLHSGANGQTAEDISKGLELFSNDRTAVGDTFQTAIKKHNKDYLKVANKLYLAEDLQVAPQFHSSAVEKFLSEEQNVNFGQSEESAAIINNWVQNVTNGKIKDLFEKDAFNSDTALALVNAIYFKGKWDITFEDTEKKPFWVNAKSSKQVDMMSVTEVFNAADLKDLDAKVLQMSYEKSDISMLIILPNQKEGLRRLEEKISDINFVELQNQMSESYLDVYLPRFKIEFTSQLNEVLEKMGMGKMFTSEADFSNLIVDKKVKVDKAIHKAFIAVNEQGTEAGAATGYTLKFYTIPGQFNADHPFMFAIVSKSAVLFLGRYVG